MIALTYGFLPSEDMYDSMIAPRDGDLYNSVVNRVYSAPKAFDRIDSWRELYKHWSFSLSYYDNHKLSKNFIKQINLNKVFYN